MPSAPFYDCCFSPDGEFLVGSTVNSQNASGFIYQRSGSTFTKIATNSLKYTVTSPASQVAWSPDSRFIYFGTNAGLAISERVGTTVTHVTVLQNDMAIYCTDVSPDGNLIAIGGTKGIKGDLYVYQKTGDKTWSKVNVTIDGSPNSPALTGFIWGVKFSPDGKYLMVTNKGGDKVTLYSISGTALTKVSGAFPSAPAGNPGRVDWSPSGKYLAVSELSSGPNVVIYKNGI